jgi:Flp pilus assembly protein TadB
MMTMQKMSMAETLKSKAKEEKLLKQQQQQQELQLQQQQQQQRQQQQQQQQHQHHQQQNQNKKKKSFHKQKLIHKNKQFDLGVLDLLTAIVYCYFTYFVLCLFQKFVNFLSNECYFVAFLLLLLGFIVIQMKQYFRSTI